MTIAETLHIRPGTSLWFSPIEWLHVLGPLPPGVTMAGDPAGASVSVMFVSNAQSVRWFVDVHRPVLAMLPTLWLCYPSPGRPDFNRTTLMTMAGAHGLHPIGDVAVMPGWSALRFGRLAPGERPTVVAP